ncbi:MAG: hypothetical protein ACOX6Y_11875 [Christensenellales bacterium]|jgi:hypothetical protein
MRKKCFSLLIIGALQIFLLPALAQEAFPRFVTKQEPLEASSVLDASASYTFTSHTSARIASQSYLSSHPNEEIGLDTDTKSKQVTGEKLLKLGLSPLGVSPDGSSALLTDGKLLFAKKGNDIRMLALNAEKSGGSLQAEDYFHKPPASLKGVEGVVFSADGRYMVMPHAMRVLNHMVPQPLMVMDAEKGEIFPIRSYDDLPFPASFFQAVFSPDSAQIYYTEMIDNTLRLCRYTFETNTHETLLNTNEQLFGWPGIALKDDGALQCYVSLKMDNYLATFTPENGHYSLHKEKLPRTIDPSILTGTP